MSKQVWKLKPGADQRIRGHHPWVYSNELAESPKGIVPGSVIELLDSNGQFLARGYGNPASLISFRALTWDSREFDPGSVESLVKRLGNAWKFRVELGFGEVSFRLCYGEADDLPGLVIDRYRTADGQVFSIQAHTAGADRMLENVIHALEKLETGVAWEKTSIVIRNDLNVRKLEGLEPQDPKIFKASRDVNDVTIAVRSASGGEPLGFRVDLLHGQKTGFFLDQFSNIQLAVGKIPKSTEPLRVLDLCCYVGQWGAQLTRALGRGTHVTAADASMKALEFARVNVEAAGGICDIQKMDVMDDLPKLEPHSYDVVICDPPALIKGRKDLAAGSRGYLKLNTNAMRLVKPGGWFVSCSCSALFEESDFVSMLSRSARRNGMEFKWVARGTPSADHPLRTEFREGHYLKCWIGRAGPNVASRTHQVQTPE
ncbi:MAG: class I SAM-dependent rRNA methyltransferase [Bdellovibrionia bacterium]